MNRLIIEEFPKCRRGTVLIDGKITDMIVEDKNDIGIYGTIFVGIVKTITPSKFAFVDIGADKNGFINLNDNKDQHLLNGNKSILKQGDVIAVQVIKESIGEKGPALTTELSFSGEYVVIFKTNKHSIGVSQKIASSSKREKLKEIGKKLVPENYGIIMRTSCQNITEDLIESEITELVKIADKIISIGNYAKPPCIIYGKDQIIKSLLTENIENITANSKNVLSKAKNEICENYSNINIEYELIETEQSILGHFYAEKQFERIMGKKVWLKSGGFIIIEQTEACVVIDVNSGKNVESNSLSEMSIKTNKEAGIEIMYQLKMRNLSGVIIIDFIDVNKPNHAKEIIALLENEGKKDRVSINVLGMTKLGFVEMTRKKTSKSLFEITRNLGGSIY